MTKSTASLLNGILQDLFSEEEVQVHVMYFEDNWIFVMNVIQKREDYDYDETRNSRVQ